MTTDVETERIQRLYATLEAPQRSRAPTTRELPPDAKREYEREIKRRSREKARQAAAEGRLEARSDVIRDVLADVALIVLASGAPGADAIERLLGIAFSARPGVAGTVRAKARAGAIRPKLLTPGVLKTHAMSQTALAISDRAPDVPPDPGDELKSGS
jgi:hypothetical protein